ncbi:Cobalt-zinc-cadmium resistance protein CzcC precursor [Maioricimonas rarisocia]|uniref:Cobalt-zinc-cadmium resistance protein CzcC n=1 Tax=Maioricimonas rarisocia TaxID=2528026 RepID=A0A517ZCC7_9PLAN|nr:TolC family protein [Maioricimonas rarisocia]QDU40109.1 Cobalt-zinc-cadmium resistance protein CzcC precursor [Maioricimonas rarisocia]
MSVPRCITYGLLALLATGAGDLCAQPASHPRGESADHRATTPRIVSPRRIGRRFTEPPAVPALTAPEWASAVPRPEHEGPYDLELLLSLACENNPTIRQSRLFITAQLAKAIQAGLYPNPEASYVGEQIGLMSTPGEWQGAEIEQRFVTAGKLHLSRSKYLQRAQVAEHLAVAQQFRVCNDVRIHFVRALAAMRITELQRELLKTAEDLVRTVHEMHNLGQANRADAHRANALLQNHRLKVLQAENESRRHLVELSALVGLDLMLPRLEGQLESERPLIDFESAAAQILQCSPELLAAYAKLREDSITIQREEVEWVPDIIVSGGAGYNFVDNQTTAAARVRIEIPLFDRNQGTIDQALADYSRQQAEIRRTQLDLQRRLAKEYDTYITALQHVTEYESVILPEKRAAYRVALESYKDDREIWPDVLNAYEDYTNSRIQYVRQLQQRRISETMIDGYLLHDGLKMPTGPVPDGHIDSVPKPR